MLEFRVSYLLIFMCSCLTIIKMCHYFLHCRNVKLQVGLADSEFHIFVLSDCHNFRLSNVCIGMINLVIYLSFIFPYLSCLSNFKCFSIMRMVWYIFISYHTIIFTSNMFWYMLMCFGFSKFTVSDQCSDSVTASDNKIQYVFVSSVVFENSMTCLDV